MLLFLTPIIPTPPALSRSLPRVDVDEKPNLEIPMGEVDASILAKVVEYCKYHHLPDRTTEEMERWENDFVNVDKSTLFHLILVCRRPSYSVLAMAANQLICGRSLPSASLLRFFSPLCVVTYSPCSIRQAANFLDIQPLLDLTCKTVANMIKGKTPDQIRAEFGIPNDFTPEELEDVRRDNAWCDDRS